MTNFSDDFNDRPTWGVGVGMSYAQFGFQGDRQFYGNATGFMRMPPSVEHFRVGSDGRECWCFFVGRSGDSPERQTVTYRPYNAVREKLVVICDPFGAKRFPATQKAIESLKLEYLGAVTRKGKKYHRIRSWASSTMMENTVQGLRDWLIDAQSLLPVVCDSYWSGGGQRYDFVYSRIDEPIAAEKFQSPRGADTERKLWELEEGYDYFGWRVCDGSDGEMHVGYYQEGPKGGNGSGG